MSWVGEAVGNPGPSSPQRHRGCRIGPSARVSSTCRFSSPDYGLFGPSPVNQSRTPPGAAAPHTSQRIRFSGGFQAYCPAPDFSIRAYLSLVLICRVVTRHLYLSSAQLHHGALLSLPAPLRPHLHLLFNSQSGAALKKCFLHAPPSLPQSLAFNRRESKHS